MEATRDGGHFQDCGSFRRLTRSRGNNLRWTSYRICFIVVIADWDASGMAVSIPEALQGRAVDSEMAPGAVCTNHLIGRRLESNAGNRTAEIHRGIATTRILEAAPPAAPHGRNDTDTGETKTIDFLALAAW